MVHHLQCHLDQDYDDDDDANEVHHLTHHHYEDDGEEITLMTIVIIMIMLTIMMNEGYPIALCINKQRQTANIHLQHKICYVALFMEYSA